jgi:hypothetical protein
MTRQGHVPRSSSAARESRFGAEDLSKVELRLDDLLIGVVNPF